MHPIILAAIHQADAQAFVVKQIEGELLPTVSLEGTVSHDDSFDTDLDPNYRHDHRPGLDPALSRAASSTRASGRPRRSTGCRRSRSTLPATRCARLSSPPGRRSRPPRTRSSPRDEGVEAAEIALCGVQEEQRVGQRTTLDVLDAQQVLLDARETLVLARRDRVVASFSLLSAMGRLTAEALRLPTAAYDPTEHYQAVRGQFIGVTTPDGR